MRRSSQHRQGGDDGEYGEEDKAQPIKHHCSKLPVGFNGSSFLITFNLLSDHFYLFKNQVEFPLKGMAVTLSGVIVSGKMSGRSKDIMYLLHQ